MWDAFIPSVSYSFSLKLIILNLDTNTIKKAKEPLLVFKPCHFNYDVSQCRPLWVQLVWDSLISLGLCEFFILHIREDFSHYFFKYVLYPSLTVSFSWYSHDEDVVTLHVVQNVSYALIIFL